MKILMLFLVVLLTSSAVSAQYGAITSRNDTWETALVVAFTNDKDIDFKNGSSLELDNAVGWGFNLGYNLDNHWRLGFEGIYSRPGYKATIVEDANPGNTRVINHRATQFSGHFNVHYHFLPGEFTPFVMGGLGWTHFNSNVLDGGSVIGCWRGPWGFLRCDRFLTTYSNSEFTYNLGVGLRWDFAPGMFLRASANNRWMDMGFATDRPQFLSGRIEIGWSMD